MVIPQHCLVGAQVEFVVVLGELVVADCGVFVHDAADLKYTPCFHPVWVALELYDLYIRVVGCLHDQG